MRPQPTQKTDITVGLGHSANRHWLRCAGLGRNRAGSLPEGSPSRERAQRRHVFIKKRKRLNGVKTPAHRSAGRCIRLVGRKGGEGNRMGKLFFCTALNRLLLSNGNNLNSVFPAVIYAIFQPKRYAWIHGVGIRYSSAV